MTIEEFYDSACRLQPGDLSINRVGFGREGTDMTAHLPLLKLLASQCTHVTEFGLREGYSSAAILSGLSKKGKLVSYDIALQLGYHKIDDIVLNDTSLKWEFYQQNTVEPGFEIQYTDFLFIDDLHTYDQVRQELAQHGHKVLKYLGFHDTYSQGEKSLDVVGQKGILPAIEEYTKANGWKLIYKVDFNHGLMIFGRE